MRAAREVRFRSAASRVARRAWLLAGRFGRDERGVTAVVYGIVFAVVLLAAAVGVDHGRLVTEVSRDQWALDAALLAAADRLGSDDQDVSGPEMARAFYTENRRRSAESRLTDIVFDADAGEVSARTHTIWTSTLLKAFGYDTTTLSVGGRVIKGNGSVEIALALDNSGSMAGVYIADLKTAATNLVELVFAGSEGSENVKVGIVPFAGSVNIGSGYAGEDWMDQTGLSSIHYQDFSGPRTRSQLFADLGVGWGGCVEVRPGIHATTDSVPTTADGDTLFVPMFAPDEPDDANAGSGSYNNSYVVDDGGSCTPQACTCTSYSRRGRCTNWSLTPVSSPAAAQARTCKYAGGGSAPRDQCSRGSQSGPGPNYMCTTRPVLPLTSNKSDVELAIQSMVANGNTNIAEGVMWGWRVLSPGVPFAEGRVYEDRTNDKYLIVMTDGQNTYPSAANHNRSRYGAYGYADPYAASAPDRLGTTYSSTAYVSRIDANTRAACANAKAEGITVYSVAFRLESDPATQALLRECASSGDKAFTASDGEALNQAFQKIAREISKLRIAG